MPSYSQVSERLGRVGQLHLLRFYNELTSSGQNALLAQIDSLDLESLPELVRQHIKNKPPVGLPSDLGPAPYFPNDPTTAGRAWDRAGMQRVGEDLLRQGKVAAFVVAGGQGSRLGFDGPKGCFPTTPINGKSLFNLFAEHILGAKERYGVHIPWYIMTSPLNHEATVSFFEQNQFFGLSPEDLMFFPQGVCPSFDIKTGQVLLASKGEVATNPDGHGGSIKALAVSGALDDMRKRGVQHISYFQVDNPSVRALDPIFLGLHAAGVGSSGEMSSKMIKKAGPDEKVGVFCLGNGKVQVIEYSDLPSEFQHQRLEDGTLRFIAGSIAIHTMSVDFVDRLANDPAFALPYHRAEKKIPCVDLATGEVVAPKENNGVKLERFVFDALPLCRESIVFETDRVEEFAPIKNATGVDSIQTSTQLQTLRSARWLEAAGVKVPRKPDGSPDCVLEVSPRTATSADELNTARDKLPREVRRGERLAL